MVRGQSIRPRSEYRNIKMPGSYSSLHCKLFERVLIIELLDMIANILALE